MSIINTKNSDIMYTDELKGMKRNIRIVYALAFFHTFMLIAPVLVPFFESKGLTLSEIFYLQAIFAITIVLLEAPSGYLADKMGRRAVLVIGSVAHGAGYLFLVFADGFWQLAVFEIILGIAMSMMSGADLALLYDTQRAINKAEDEHSHSIANLASTKSFANGAGALLGGAMALWSFDAILLTQAALSWVCLALAMFLAEPPIEQTTNPLITLDFRALYKHLLKGDKVLRQVFIAIPLYNLSTFQVAWLVQPYWQEQGLTMFMFGVLWFAQSVTVGIASQCGHMIEKRKGAVFALLMIGILPIFGHFGMAWFDGWYGIGICFILFFCRGLYQVVLVNALNKRVPGQVRATVNSLTSLTFRFGFIFSGPVVGHIAETRGLTSALNLLGLASIAMFLLIMLPLIRTVRSLQQRPRVSA